jgi:hypothetical protein
MSEERSMQPLIVTCDNFKKNHDLDKTHLERRKILHVRSGFETEERKLVAPSAHADLENRRDEMVSP